MNTFKKGNPNRRRLTGNVAVAKFVLSSGVSYWQEATSKTKPQDRPVESPDALTSKNGELYTGPKKHFAAYRDQDHSEKPFNDTHAEYKIFNALADILEKALLTEDTFGILYLYTEREMCTGCDLTCQEFWQLFEQMGHIEILVFWTRKHRK